MDVCYVRLRAVYLCIEGGRRYSEKGRNMAVINWKNSPFYVLNNNSPALIGKWLYLSSLLVGFFTIFTTFGVVFVGFCTLHVLNAAREKKY